MGKHRLAKPRRRWSVAVAVLAALPVAAVLTASTGGPPSRLTPDGTACCAELVAAAQELPATQIAAHYTVLTQADLAASRSAVHRSSLRALPAGLAPERGLQIKTILAERLISAYFPEIHSIGGVRPDPLKWHPMGLAIDVMIPDYRSPAGKELGDRIAAFVLANADRLSINHVIWRRIIYSHNGKASLMPNLGGDDANHYTHVHIATDGGGYPTGSEQYFG